MIWIFGRRVFYFITLYVSAYIFCLYWSTLSQLGPKEFQTDFTGRMEHKGLPSRRKFSVIARILSNDLPPLHSEQMTYLNTQYILEKENLPPSFKRLWIINSVLDKEKEQKLISLLTFKSEWFLNLSIPSSVAYSKEIEQLVFNVNRARNLAVEVGLNSGASWVFVFDGCTFLTAETLKVYETLTQGIYSSVFHFTPMYRLHFKIGLEQNMTYKQVFPFVSGLQECHLAVNHHYLSIMHSWNYTSPGKGFLFDETRPYAKANKLDILQHLRYNFPEITSCNEAYIGYEQMKAGNSTEDGYLVKKCGYSIRLLYKPEPEAPFVQDLQRPHLGNNRRRSKKLMLEEIQSLFPEESVKAVEAQSDAVQVEPKPPEMNEK